MFTFGQYTIGIEEATDILKCTKRTIQNYYHPEKRDPVKWHYLELHATRRILPPALSYDRDTLHTDTGYSYPIIELQQWSFYQSMRSNLVAELTAENAALKARISGLEQQRPQPQAKPANNVINFPTRNHGALQHES